MKLQLIQQLRDQLVGNYSLDDKAFEINPELCPSEMTGDITINCFRLAKDFKKNPISIAKEVTSILTQHPDVSEVECVKAFVNVVVYPIALFRDTLGIQKQMITDLELDHCDRKKILVEFSAPNTNKPQHLGHVRNNIFGMALTSILARVGHNVIPVNLINDRGIHICKSMIAYQIFGDAATPKTTGKKGDHFVGDYYVRFEKEFRKQVEELKEERADLSAAKIQDLFLETEIGNSAQNALRLWENNDSQVRKLWKKMNSWVLHGFAETYQRLGVTFENTYFESETYNLGRELVLKEESAEIFYRTPDGALEVDLDDHNLGKKIILRKDGTSVYVTQDIGTTVLKYNDFEPDKMIWIVGDEQKYHFNVLFAILKKMGYPWANSLFHLSYGMVNLPTGRMKSREGTVVDADDLFDEMYDLAKNATLERSEGVEPTNLDERARVISMGALKFMLLKVNPKTTIAFDPNASLKFEGDTGPYVQYVYARIASILRKFKELSPDLREIEWDVLGEKEERVLALRCGLYKKTVHKSAIEFDPSILSQYLLDLTKDFNRFYKKHSVLSAKSTKLIEARVGLCRCVQDILKDGLKLLSIETLEKM